MCSQGVDANPFGEAEDKSNLSVVYVGVDRTLAGLIYFQDQIREDSASVVESLSTQGIDVYMLSGDKKNSAEYVASVVGIPKDKVRKLQQTTFYVTNFETLLPQLNQRRHYQFTQELLILLFNLNV